MSHLVIMGPEYLHQVNHHGSLDQVSQEGAAMDQESIIWVQIMCQSSSLFKGFKNGSVAVIRSGLDLLRFLYLYKGCVIGPKTSCQIKG